MLATSPLPVTGNITLPDQSTGITASITASATDDAGKTIIWGESLPVEFDDLEGVTLDIFVQRTGQFAILPAPLPAAPPGPLLCILDGRFVLATGGPIPADQENTQIYDLLDWAPLENPPPLPVAPLSIACTGTQALLLNGENSDFYDFSDSAYTEATAPTGGSFAEVTGGGSVATPDGSTFVIAGTNPTMLASSAVMYMDSQENLSFATLKTERQGRRPAFVPALGSLAGRGLVVVGGAATGSALEICRKAGRFHGDHAVRRRYDGRCRRDRARREQRAPRGRPRLCHRQRIPGARVFDLDCVPPKAGGFCTPVAWNAPMVTMPSAQAFTIDAKTAFVVGNDASNNTHAYVITSTTATEIKFNVARKGATALRLPTGPIVVVGGDVTMESFYLPPTQ